MIKTHNITKLKYLCKTILEGKRFNEYVGSGKYWLNHIKAHGNNISTEIIYETDDFENFKKFAIDKSIEYDVINSSEWANLILEGGEGFHGNHKEETKNKISCSSKGRHISEEAKINMSKAQKGKKLTVEHRKNLSLAQKRRSEFSVEHRKNLSKALTGNKNGLGYKHTEEAKQKIKNSKMRN